VSLYITRQLKLLVSESQQGINPIVSRGNDEEKITTQTALAEASGNKIVVASEASDLQLPMGSGITAGRLFYLESDQDLVLKLGGSDALRALAVTVPQTGKIARVFLDVEFNSIYVSNEGDDDANVVYAVIGS